MRLHSSFVLFALLYASHSTGAQPVAVPVCADLHLVPIARECSALKTIPIGLSGLVVAGSNSKDEFASRDLEEFIKSIGIRTQTDNGVAIHLERAESVAARKLLEAAS